MFPSAHCVPVPRSQYQCGEMRVVVKCRREIEEAAMWAVVQGRCSCPVGALSVSPEAFAGP
jgi:hypothetical protein